ncbi:hypothetical protein GCM10010869_00870 [Mesorhizobium tianshanense]|nr:hypothetical protein GCM10010869_00870 [Mesorhizobium tianshanense]
MRSKCPEKPGKIIDIFERSRANDNIERHVWQSEFLVEVHDKGPRKIIDAIDRHIRASRGDELLQLLISRAYVENGICRSD